MSGRLHLCDAPGRRFRGSARETLILPPAGRGERGRPCGTIGGPVGLIYFLKANFAALGYHQLERRTPLAGFVLMPALLISTILLPEDFPGFPFAIAYIVSALYVSSRHQMTRKAILDSPNHEFHSNWRVLGIGILCLAISAIILIAPIAALFLFGVSDI